MFQSYAEDFEDIGITFMCIGKEVGEKCGTPHLQGTVSFNKPKRFAWLCKWLGGRAHVMKCAGSEEENEAYCSKQNLWIKVGEITHQGMRSDLKGLSEVLAKNSSIKRAVLDGAIRSGQALRTAECLLKYVERKRDFAPKVVWIYGPPGVGKSRKAHELAGGDAFVKTSGSGKWFDGYDAHKSVILDDFRDSQMGLTDLLGLLDRYEYRVETKGGTRQMLAEVIIITSVFAPWQMYRQARGEPIEQLKRRVSEVLCIGT